MSNFLVEIKNGRTERINMKFAGWYLGIFVVKPIKKNYKNYK